MRVYDSVVKEASARLADLTGTNLPSTVVSLSDSMTVQFTSDLYVNMNGFTATYRSHNFAVQSMEFAGRNCLHYDFFSVSLRIYSILILRNPHCIPWLEAV